MTTRSSVISQFLLILSLFITVHPAVLNAALAEPSDSLYGLPLSFRDETGRTIPYSSWKGRYVVTSMVYLSCKASCPVMMEKLKRIEKALQEQEKQVEFVIVSFDPERDTPEELAKFKEGNGLNAHWHLFTGTKESVRTISFLLGFSYQKVDGTVEFNHSNRVLLLGPDGTILKTLDRLDADHAELVASVKASSKNEDSSD